LLHALEIPTLNLILRRRAVEDQNRSAYAFLRDGEVEAERLTYGELDCRARAIAARLQAIASPGDRALLLYPPGLEFIAAFFGCLYAGVAAVPAYPPRSQRQDPRLRVIAADAAPRVVLTTSALLAACGPSVPETFHLATDVLPGHLADEWREPHLTGEELALLQYTSGTTRTPKGVEVTHANLMHNEEMISRAFDQSDESVVVGWLPLYHDMGLIGGILQPLYAGAHCVLMSPMAFLQRPARWLEAITHYRGTTSGGPNFAYDLCVRKVPPAVRERLDLSSWRVAFSGAEPVRADTLERFAASFSSCGFRRRAFFPCYGLAEATLFVTGGSPEEEPVVEGWSAAALEEGRVEAAAEGRRLVGCGRPSPGQTVVIADPDQGAECPPGRVGEIWIAGPPRRARLRRSLPAHRRPGLLGRRRAVCGRPAQGPDHHPWPQPLPAGP
jgi:acyl-CoA synthetase (AMP-forming)/AMP-acid ligase II